MRQPGHRVYLISVAAEMLDMHPQTLRKYERAGFIDPDRAGALRLYSEDDLVRLRLIKHFVETLGLNLAGIHLTLSVVNDLLALRASLRDAGSPEGRAAIVRIDNILAERFAMHVVEHEGPNPPRRELPPSTSVFDLSNREAIEFLQPPAGAAQSAR